ncbi:glycine/D-amino acid oxidase-like deaminating enzyme [Kribbella amoyensis]|uniref:Glycine/D-amino acid oxidase-like deaminating enzyme n=1 Tax=Kribbella amoyensis TaxID=996641 RepID=A0A561BZB2_9ACTN|nr:glycine/D-amino acid oxidase-like deaminating enzyme [Kribbella amoyensis]
MVGAGMVGASVAYHAAKAGAAVTLVDAGKPGSGVSVDSFAWIAANITSGPASELRAAAADEYHRLEAELPGLPVTWSGSLSWRTGESAPETVRGQQIVDAATAVKLEPTLRQPPDWAVWAPDEGGVDPVGVIERMIAGAREYGAQVHPEVPVTAVGRDSDGRIVEVDTASGPLSATTVVLAAGAATAALAAPLGVQVPVEPSPATLFRFRAPAGLIRTVVNTQDFDIRQVAPDRIIAAADSQERTLDAIKSTFRGGEHVELLSARIGARPMPADGEPIIGPVAEAPGLYLAVMHAAVTLAPAVGRMIAAELVNGTTEPALAGSRLDRF